MMKKITIIASPMLGATIASSAQQFYWGVNGGLLYNTSSTDKHSRPKNNSYVGDRKLGTSANFGVNLGYQFKSRWGVELQLQGVSIRSKDIIHYNFANNPSQTPIELEEQLRYTYLRIPISVTFRITNPASKIRLDALVGGNIGFLLSNNSKLVGTNAEGKEYVNRISYYARSVMKGDLGIQAGLRASKKINHKLAIFLDASYYNGFTFRYDEIFPYNYNQYVYNQYLTTNIGLKLEMGKKNKI